MSAIAWMAAQPKLSAWKTDASQVQGDSGDGTVTDARACKLLPELKRRRHLSILEASRFLGCHYRATHKLARELEERQEIRIIERRIGRSHTGPGRKMLVLEAL